MLKSNAFISNEVEQLCAMLNEWEIHHKHKELHQNMWQFIKDNGFLGLGDSKDMVVVEFSSIRTKSRHE